MGFFGELACGLKRSYVEMIWIGIQSIYMYTCNGCNLFTVDHPNRTKCPPHALLPSYQDNTHIPHFTTSTKCLVWQCRVVERQPCAEVYSWAQNGYHSLLLCGKFHTLYTTKRVYYSRKHIGFRSNMTWTFKRNDKLEIGNVPTNRGLWIRCPLIHNEILCVLIRYGHT